MKKNGSTVPPVLYAGIDDATKCPVIGSIMLAGVVADDATVQHWSDIGVKDSKLLTRKRRDELAREIRRTAVTTSLEPIPPNIIDDKSLNLNGWEMVAMFRLVQRLRRRARFTDVTLDNWEVSRDVFDRRYESICREQSILQLRQRGVEVKPRTLNRLHFIAEHRADENHVIVGAASILAKAASDREYDKLRKTYGDFGSGNPGDRKTRRFLWRHRHDPPPIVRTSWKTFDVISSLDDIADDPLQRPVS